MSPETLSLGLVWYVVFLLSLTCHEAAHALAAKWGGDLTAALQGQASLNPIPHIRREPFGTVIAPIASYLLGGWMIGWGSAPYDRRWQRSYPRRAAGMALAGPLANLGLVLLAAMAIRVGIAWGVLAVPPRAGFTRVVVAAVPSGVATSLAVLLSILFALNLLLAAFNLLPFPPLDGINALGLFLPEGIALRLADFSRNRTFALLGILIGWRVFGAFFYPLFGIALNVLYPSANYP